MICICPKWGCEEDFIDEIAVTLQNKVDTKIQTSRVNIDYINQKLDMIITRIQLNPLQVQLPDTLSPQHSDEQL